MTKKQNFLLNKPSNVKTVNINSILGKKFTGVLHRHLLWLTKFNKIFSEFIKCEDLCNSRLPDEIIYLHQQ
jgi:hypothetical protein